MAEHYTRNTTGVFRFCNRCGRLTMHKVSNRRIGLCTEDHYAGKAPLVCTPKVDVVDIEPCLF